MAISKTDMKMLGASAGVIAGGEITSKTTEGTPASYAGSVAKGTGILGLGYVGSTELLENKINLARGIIEHHKRQAIGLGGAISSSARRAAPGLKLLAGKIAQGANKVI